MTLYTSDTTEWEICTELQINGKQEFALALCSNSKAAQNVLIMMNQTAQTFLQFCEIEVIGFALGKI